MSAHDWSLSFDASGIYGACQCGATAIGRLFDDVVSNLGGSCPGPVKSSHDWRLVTRAGVAVAVCPPCSALRRVPIEEALMGRPASRLDLSGECSALVSA